MSWYSVTARPFDHQSWKLTLHICIHIIYIYAHTLTYFVSKHSHMPTTRALKMKQKERMQRLHPYSQSDPGLPTTKEITHYYSLHACRHWLIQQDRHTIYTSRVSVAVTRDNVATRLPIQAKWSMHFVSVCCYPAKLLSEELEVTPPGFQTNSYLPNPLGRGKPGWAIYILEREMNRQPQQLNIMYAVIQMMCAYQIITDEVTEVIFASHISMM